MIFCIHATPGMHCFVTFPITNIIAEACSKVKSTIIICMACGVAAYNNRLTLQKLGLVELCKSIVQQHIISTTCNNMRYSCDKAYLSKHNAKQNCRAVYFK